MTTPSEVSDSVRLLEYLGRLPNRAIVGIDGIAGAGKSTLAQCLADTLAWQHVSIDGFVTPDHGGYVDFVRYDELETVIDAREGSVLLDGICLLRVLERLGRVLDAHVYLKRETSMGRWDDEDSWETDEAQILGVPVPPLVREVADYHRSSQPHLRADIVYVRREVDPGQMQS